MLLYGLFSLIKCITCENCHLSTIYLSLPLQWLWRSERECGRHYGLSVHSLPPSFLVSQPASTSEPENTSWALSYPPLQLEMVRGPDSGQWDLRGSWLRWLLGKPFLSGLKKRKDRWRRKPPSCPWWPSRDHTTTSLKTKAKNLRSAEQKWKAPGSLMISLCLVESTSRLLVKWNKECSHHVTTL